MTLQLTDTWPFLTPKVHSPAAGLCCFAPSSPTSLTRQYNHLQSPAWLTSFIQELLQLLPLQFWLQSYYSVKNLRVKTLIQMHTVNFHSLRWNSLVELIPSLFLRYKEEKYIATFRKIAGDSSNFPQLDPKYTYFIFQMWARVLAHSGLCLECSSTVWKRAKFLPPNSILTCWLS